MKLKFKMVGLLLWTLVNLVGASALAQEKKASRLGRHEFERNYGMAGCGVGSIVMGKSGGQISASTTNTTMYNQLLGITFGTFNCLDEENRQLVHSIDNFLKWNGGQVASEAVKGNGEHLVALAQIFDCNTSVLKNFTQTMHDDFEEIFEVPVYREVTDSMIRVLIRDRDLRHSCSKISFLYSSLSQ